MSIDRLNAKTLLIVLVIAIAVGSLVGLIAAKFKFPVGVMVGLTASLAAIFSARYFTKKEGQKLAESFNLTWSLGP